MGWLNFFDPVAGSLLGGSGGGNGSGGGKQLMTPVVARLPYAQANPDWNAATAPITPRISGWSANSLTSYLKAFQAGQTPKPGTQLATDQSLFPQPPADITLKQAEMNPEKLAKDLLKENGQESTTDLIPSMVSSSTGGLLSPGAASLYGRMLGTNPPPSVSANVDVKPVNPTSSGTGGVGDTNRRFHTRGQQSAWSPEDSQLYRGMTPLQKQQALSEYNQTQPVPRIR